jgi:hypothetical protein
VLSGGQTGADRAALDWAIARGVPHGGWCPAGRAAEDGTISRQYHLCETNSPDYAERTRANVAESDATVIFSIKPTLASGCALTLEFAQELGKPCLHVHADQGIVAAERQLGEFVKRNKVLTLNIAGSRISQEPSVVDFVKVVLEATFKLG